MLIITVVNTSYAQEAKSFAEQTRLIRIKKIATEWQGSKLTLHTYDGYEYNGTLMEVSSEHYHIYGTSGEVIVPLEEVIKVSFKPGPPEAILSIASALMGGGFLGGALLLADADSSPENVSLAATLGMLAGGFWGYTTFYEVEVIELE